MSGHAAHGGLLVHGCAVILGTTGVLIRGPSGSGKSRLAAELVERAGRNGHFAAHVADDQCLLDAAAAGLRARAPQTIAGRAELRGRGIVPVLHEPAALISLVADLEPAAELERMPEADALSTVLLDRLIARQPVPSGDAAGAVALIREALRAIYPGKRPPV
ncbi:MULTISPECIES: HPr kinase/phosphorylase [unclassified Pannonibacter]|uniref:HPr kinase/phosphorylase n=1 Tax=unclassified Pannonibacter TaxID=2627228 RepID=UPI00164545FB|nr:MULTISPECIES: serine/threonine protein kinase [unclassified Pannonibacter]